MSGRLIFVLCTVFGITTIAYYFWRTERGGAVRITTLQTNNTISSIFDTCPLILYNHLDKQLLPFYHPNYNPKAGCKVYNPITTLVNGRVNLSSNSSKYKCKARCILPYKNDTNYTATSWTNVPSPSVFKCDIIETECVNKGSIESFLHTQIYEQETSKTNLKHDVYILVIDSMSSFMAKRSLPKTIKYLSENMAGVQMEFLDKVGYNSRSNGFPLAFEGGSRDLVGLPPLIPDWNDTEICGKYLDEYSYYLKEYGKMGYKTMIACDYDVSFVYYFRCLGFSENEADHIWRPFDIRRKESKNFKKSLWKSCSERHLEMMEYWEKFMNAYPGTPKIAQVWPTTLAHETLKDLYHADEHFLKFFQKNQAILNRSFLFFMSDHGPRREGIEEVELGQYENRNPFLMVTVPLQYRNAAIHRQLEEKALKLMTHFDIHATLMDILKLQPSTDFSDTSYRDMQPLSKGSSLFREWRGQRNCRTLPIPSQYCICQYNWTNVKDEKFRTKLGTFLAQQLNLLLINAGVMQKCQKQFYKSDLQPVNATMKQLRDVDSMFYNVVVSLSPSKGLFSAYIRFNTMGLVLASGITRHNRYGRQGDCLVGHQLQPLCHCKGTSIP